MPEPEAPSILVVEDDARNMILTRAILARRHYRVTSARSLKEARERLAEELPDLILLDVRLPDGDGLELARDLRADPSALQVKVIVISASVLPDDRAAVVSAGCDAFIAKPIHPAELLERVDGFIAAAGAALLAESEPGSGPRR